MVTVEASRVTFGRLDPARMATRRTAQRAEATTSASSSTVPNVRDAHERLRGCFTGARATRARTRNSSSSPETLRRRRAERTGVAEAGEAADCADADLTIREGLITSTLPSLPWPVVHCPSAAADICGWAFS